MSGLKNEPHVGSKFVNFKEGKLVSAVTGSKETYTNLVGHITNLDIVDEEYKDKEYRKIVLDITDDEGETYKLGFPLESGYGNAFCSLAKNIDFKKPVDISGGQKPMENGKSYGVVYIKQDGANLKWFYTKESKELPQGVKGRDRAGEYTDYSERNDFFHKLLIEQIFPAIQKAQGKAEEKGKGKK